MTDTTTLTKLTKPVATFISLVHRGANQLPFKVIKGQRGDAEMNKGLLNLSTLASRIKKGANSSAAIVGVATTPGKDPEAVTKLLKGFGLEVQLVSKSANGDVFVIEEVANEADVHTVQLDTDVAVLVKGFSPWADGLVANSSFAEIVQAQSFFTSIRSASDALSDCVYEHLRNNDKAEARAKIADVLTQYQGWVLQQIDGLPEKSFKMAKELGDIKAAEPVTKADPTPDKPAETTAPATQPVTPPETQPAAQPAATPAATAPVTPAVTPAVTTEKPAETAGTVETPAGTTEQPAPAAGEGTAVVEKSASGDLMTLIKAAVSEVVKPLSDKVEGVVQKQADLDSTISNTNAKISGTLVNNVVKSEKSATGGNTQESGDEGYVAIDTAYDRRHVRGG